MPKLSRPLWPPVTSSRPSRISAWPLQKKSAGRMRSVKVEGLDGLHSVGTWRLRPYVRIFPLGSSTALIATAGQAIGAAHCPCVPAATADASGSKLTTTPTFRLRFVVQDSATASVSATEASHPPPAQALSRWPGWIFAVSFTRVPRANPALQFPAVARPLVMVQLMPLGVE